MPKYFCQTKKQSAQIKSNIAILKALADLNRLQIICFLKSQKRCVCEIVAFLNLPQNLISHHLKVLKENNLLKSKKEGNKIYYSLNKTSIKNFLKDFRSLMS